MRIIHSVQISDEAEIGAARRAVHAYAGPFGFTETELAELDIVAQEIGTNAVRYATGGGWLHFTTPLGAAAGVEIFYWDQGPGIDDLDRAVRDGVSTSGGLGAGLGAVRRLMDEFDVYSTVKTSGRLAARSRTTHGTALLGRKWVAARTPAARPSPHPSASAAASRGGRAAEALAERIGVWSRPYRGEDVNGDGYFIGQHGTLMLLAVIDGLGHGRGAHEASRVATGLLEQWKGEPLEDVVWAMHDALRATRGAVIGAAVVDTAERSMHYVGIGNAEVRVCGLAETVHLIPTNGMLGGRLRGLRVQRQKWEDGATLVMTTDGLSAKWDMTAYPGLLKKSPQLLAGILMRDYGRDSDDATVLVAR